MSSEKKYELTNETKIVNSVIVYRIRLLRDHEWFKKGDLLGWVESEYNLSQTGSSLVYGNASVFGNARVYDNAYVCGNASVFGNARVYDNVYVCGNANVFGNARVYDNVYVCDNARVYGSARVFSDARVCNDAHVCGKARVFKPDHVITVNGINRHNVTVWREEDGNHGAHYMFKRKVEDCDRWIPESHKHFVPFLKACAEHW